MEAILLFILAGILIGTPIAVLVALARTSRLNYRLDLAENEISRLREQLSERGTTPAGATQRAPTPKPAPAPMPKVAPASPAVAAPVKPAPLPPPLPPRLPPPLPPLPAVAARAVEAGLPKLTPVGPSRPAPAIAVPPRPTVPPPPQAPVPEAVAPAAEKSSEARLGSWWATRIGITFLVAAVVSFGIYVSKDSPMLRVLAVLAVAAGVTGLGKWLERKTAAFGQVLFAGGLALFYFTTYAAHALPNMRVVESPLTGLLLQFVAVALVTVVALWRDRPVIASMAIFLGEWSCFFALGEEQYAWTLGAALGLLVVSALLRAGKGWVWPLGFGYVGAQLCYAAAVLALAGQTLDPGAGLEYALGRGLGGGFNASITLWYPAIFFVVLIAGDVWAQGRGRSGPSAARQASVWVAALAYGLGAWWGGQVLGGEEVVARNLLVAAGLSAGAAVVYWRRGELAGLGEVLFTAAGAWLAVYFLYDCVGAARWTPLLAEAFVFGAWVRRQRSGFAWAGMAGSWALSGLVALDCTQGDRLTWMELSGPAAVPLAWTVASAGLWGWLAQMTRPLEPREQDGLQLGAVLTALWGIVLGWMAWSRGEQQWLFLLLAGLAAVLGGILRTRAPWQSAGAALAASWLPLVLEGEPEAYQWLLPLGEVFLLAAWVRRRQARWTWILLIGGWMVSAFVAVGAATGLPHTLAAWDSLRLQFLAWPLLAALLWTWLERPARDFQDDEKRLPAAGGVSTGVLTVVIGGLAWDGDPRAWLFLAVAASVAALAATTKTRGGWGTSALALLSALWAYHSYDHTPLVGATPEAGTLAQHILALGALTLTVLAATFFLQRRASGTSRAGWATALEWLYALSLLRLWVVVTRDQMFPAATAPIAIALAALGLALLAGRGPWRALGDVAWCWNAAALALWGYAHRADEPLKAAAWLCLAATVALAWWWGVLARRDKPAVTLLRFDVAGWFLPSVLLVGWTWAVQALNNTDAGRAVDAIIAALAYTLVARRNWLPSAAVSAIIVACRAWVLSVGLHPESLRECGPPALVMTGLLAIGWIGARRVRWELPELRAALPFMLAVLAVAALAAFDLPASRLTGADDRHYLTLLWGLAGGLAFAIGLAGRLKPYRYAGLAALALCLPRLFLVDITDTLARIFAFGALAVVLLAIGFSYDRLRPWIEGSDADDATGPNSPAPKPPATPPPAA